MMEAGQGIIRAQRRESLTALGTQGGPARGAGSLGLGGPWEDAESLWAVRDLEVGQWREKGQEEARSCRDRCVRHQPEGLGLSPGGTREPWEGWEQERDGDQTHRRSQQVQVQADRARMSVAQGGVGTQGQPLFRKRFPEEGTWELRQEGPVKRMSQAETWRWEELAQFGEQHTVQSRWSSKWDLR